MSNAHAWRITRRSIGTVTPLGLAGAALVAVIGPDSPLPITIVVALFVLALCYVLAVLADDIKARLAAAVEEARRHREALADQAAHHREALAKQLHGAICKEALSWIGAHGHQVDRWEAAASVLGKTYESAADTSGPPSDGLRLRAVRDFERHRRISPSA